MFKILVTKQGNMISRDLFFGGFLKMFLCKISVAKEPAPKKSGNKKAGTHPKSKNLGCIKTQDNHGRGPQQQ